MIIATKSFSRTTVALAIIAGIVFFYLWSLLYSWTINGINSGFTVAPYDIIGALFSGDFNIRKYALTGLVVLIVFSATAVTIYNKHYMRKLHGDAHWASEREIRSAKLRDHSGMVIGRKRGRYLMNNGHEHVMVIGPTGSDKGVSIVIPNALNYPGSLVVLDMKEEIFNASSGYRESHGQKIYKLDFANRTGITHRFNPFAVIDFENKITRLDGLDKIASYLWSPDQDGSDIWQPGARDLFIFVAMFLNDTGHPNVNIAAILTFILGSHLDLKKAIEKHIKPYRDELDPIILRLSNSFLQMAEKERSGVRSTLLSGIRLWNNPVIAASTECSDFDIRELRSKRMSIYLTISPDNLTRLLPLVSIFIQQIIDSMVRVEPGDNEPYSVLMILDELPAYGKLLSLVNGAAYLRSYHVRLLLIAQAMTQLYSVYGKDVASTLMQNCKYKYFLRQNDYTSALLISNMLGTSSLKSLSGNKHHGLTHNVSYVKRELMKPHEIMQMNEARAIIMVEGTPPIYAKKIQYYTDHNFKDRVIAPTKIKPITIETPTTQSSVDESPDITSEELLNEYFG